MLEIRTREVIEMLAVCVVSPTRQELKVVAGARAATRQELKVVAGPRGLECVRRIDHGMGERGGEESSRQRPVRVRRVEEVFSCA